MADAPLNADSHRAPSRRRSAGRRAYDLLVSPRLAIAILVTVLACCVAGVTVYRGETAWRLIFSTLWFNALLVLLAVSSASAFFARVWRRKLTVVQVGMILFHVSFAALLGGVVYNSLFHFKGLMRLTEGETLATGRLESYDQVEAGRLFDLARLKGETTLVRMHTKYTVDGEDKRAAYEVAVNDGVRSTTGVIYVTRALEVGGIRYLCAKEGYSVLVTLSDPAGKELFGAHVPLQSIKHEKGGFLYATGTSARAQGFPFPPPPEEARAELLVTYRPSTVKEREGDVGFEVLPRGAGADAVRRGQVIVGQPFDAGAFTLTPREIRYWVGMDVRYDPGLEVILTSLCAGLLGTVLIFVGRIRQGAGRARAAAGPNPSIPAAVAAREEVA